MEDKLLSTVKRMPGRGSREPIPQPIEGEDSDKKPSRQYGTVGYLMEQFVQSESPADQQDGEGLDKTFERSADNLLNTTWPSYDLPYALTRLTDAPHGLRQDTAEDVKITYRIFTPPGHWGIHRYSILRCTVKQRDTGQPDKFMSHAGEEILYSEEKKLKYYFFNPRPDSKDLELDIDPGTIYRIRPEFPHNNFYTKEALDCWMVLRPLSGTYMTEAFPASPEEENETAASEAAQTAGRKRKTGQDEPEDEPEPATSKKSRLFVARKDLRGFSTYAMCALGLRDKIRVARLCAGLSINQVANRTSLNPSYLGRLEDGTANISFGNLARLAHLLGIDLAHLKDQLQVDPRFGDYADVSGYVHWLHPHRWDLRDGKRLDLQFEPTPLMGDTSSWIVTKGEVVFRYTPHKDNRPRKEILAQDDVLHLQAMTKDSHTLSFTPIDDACLVEVRYSARCTCGQPVHKLVKE